MIIDLPMENSHKYFCNVDCKYYPCHDFEDINCLFCYCPLYNLGCHGDFVVLNNGVKDCSECKLPHGKDGYDFVVKFLKEQKK